MPKWEKCLKATELILAFFLLSKRRRHKMGSLKGSWQGFYSSYAWRKSNMTWNNAKKYARKKNQKVAGYIFFLEINVKNPVRNIEF